MNIRVSTDKKHNLVETQKDMLRSYSKINEIKIDDYFIDFGITGKETTKRQKYMELMKLVIGSNFTTILTTSLSRWSRNIFELHKSMEIIKIHNTEVIMTKENIRFLTE